ncbi:MAG: DegV family protein [Chloroflexi bacterium]|nr:DegV family protein [Chloroflexota bacterium]
MTIKIVADSCCDIPSEIAAQLGITIVPLFINIGQQSFKDGVTISREEFYRGLPYFPTHPTTATPGPDAFKQAYEQLAQQGADEILSIHISHKLSNTVDSARIAAAETTSVPVTVLDSRQLSLGFGFVVMAAAEAAAQGKPMEEVLQAAEDRIQCTYTFAVLDTIEFLRRSGRMNLAVASIASLLRIKPLLKMYNGETEAERVRTFSRGMDRLVELVAHNAPLQVLSLVHTNAPEAAQKLRQRALHLFPDHHEPLSVNVTPVLGAHLGPGAVGFVCVSNCGRPLEGPTLMDNLHNLIYS